MKLTVISQEIFRKNLWLKNESFRNHRSTSHFPSTVFRTVYFLLQVLIKACEKVGVQFNPKGCVVAIEGPRFSTKAESRMFQTWGGDVINMSAVPEVALAKEAGLSYASLAMITDYDCWRNEGETVRNYFLQKLIFVEYACLRKLYLKIKARVS